MAYSLVTRAFKRLRSFAATLWAVLLVAAPSWAAPLGDLDYQEPEAVAPPSMGSLLLRLFISLIVVLGLAFFVLKYLQKRTAISQTGRWIRVIDQVGIGPNKALLLAEIAGRLYVLGVTDHNISKILEIKEASQVEAILEESLEPDISSLRGEILDRLRKRPFHKLLKKEVVLKNMEDNEGE